MKDVDGHIHFGADFLGSDHQAWENFYTIYNECEEILYKMSNATGQPPRQGVSNYAKTSNEVLAGMFETGEVRIKTQEDFEQVIKAMQDTRFRGVNVTNLGKDGKNTIEFRMPNGTINARRC